MLTIFRRRINIWMLTILFICSMIISACGQEKVTSTTSVVSSESVPQIDYEAIYRDESLTDVLGGNWSREDLGNPDLRLLLSEYIPGVFPYKDSDAYKESYRIFFSDDHYIYSFDHYFGWDEKNGKDLQTVCVNKLDISDKSVTSVEYAGRERSEGVFSNPYVVGGRIFVTSEAYDDEFNLTDYCVAELLPDGKISEKTNLFDVLKEHGWLSDQSYGPDTQLLYEPASDRVYLTSPTGENMIIADANGKLISTFDGFEESYNRTISDFVHTSDGHIIFLCIEGSKETVFIFENDTPKIFYSGKAGEETEFTCSTIDSHGRILFSYGSLITNLVNWDIETGIREKVYSESVDSDQVFGYDCLARNDKGEYLIMLDNNLRVLSYAGANEKVEITLKPLSIMGADLKNCIKKFEKTHPGVTINVLPDVERANQDMEINQMYTNITRGEGPEIIYLEADQLTSLADSGCLYDLSGVLRNDVAENLVPAVRDSGYYENGKYAMMVGPNLYTLIINKKYCSKDTWTIRDVLDIVEKREKEGNPFEWLAVGEIYDDDYLVTLIYNICESEFIDWGNHICDFESDDFIRMLEICKKYYDKDAKGRGDSKALMRDDKALIYVDYMLGFSRYSETMASLGDEFKTIGYPDENGVGKLVLSTGFAVNKETMENDPAKKAVIEDFLNSLYIPEYLHDQYSLLIPVRLDLFDGMIITAEGNAYIKGSGPLATKSDGTTYLDEYKTLLNNCKSLSLRDANETEIKNIIYEEAEAFFAGEKTAQDVASIIQSRVSIYLMEIG